MTVASRTVSLEPFQARFAEMEAAEPPSNGGIAPRDAAKTIALRLGWFYHGLPDGPRVRRALGLRLDVAYVRRGKRYPPQLRRRVNLETAHRLCEAMDMTPAEVDL